LSSHHDVADFDCGVAELNAALRMFKERFDLGEDVLGFVGVGSALKVVAYVILSSAVLTGPDSRQLRCFTVPALAVAHAHQGGPLFNALVVRALEAMSHRQREAVAAGVPYDGILVTPRDDGGLERWLTAGGFTPIGPSLLWAALDVRGGESLSP
jgi:hypothetical protein